MLIIIMLINSILPLLISILEKAEIFSIVSMSVNGFHVNLFADG